MYTKMNTTLRAKIEFGLGRVLDGCVILSGLLTQKRGDRVRSRGRDREKNRGRDSDREGERREGGKERETKVESAIKINRNRHTAAGTERVIERESERVSMRV